MSIIKKKQDDQRKFVVGPFKLRIFKFAQIKISLSTLKAI